MDEVATTKSPIKTNPAPFWCRVVLLQKLPDEQHTARVVLVRVEIPVVEVRAAVAGEEVERELGGLPRVGRAVEDRGVDIPGQDLGHGHHGGGRVDGAREQEALGADLDQTTIGRDREALHRVGEVDADDRTVPHLLDELSVTALFHDADVTLERVRAVVGEGPDRELLLVRPLDRVQEHPLERIVVVARVQLRQADREVHAVEQTLHLLHGLDLLQELGRTTDEFLYRDERLSAEELLETGENRDRIDLGLDEVEPTVRLDVVATTLHSLEGDEATVGVDDLDRGVHQLDRQLVAQDGLEAFLATEFVASRSEELA
ncbi:MAG: hypothetical protein UR53_C0001G0043 [Candidatus Magasanikbacteria bacterium GW2011_GWC2_34_16]|uniref:Uncharacterized protein n=1 Tax=Candidatus Magasanikbacteria bacterium GW2011_GWC2_34_16 TaxID=1619045 RepID=A0A0G0ARB7_9BACT|nr:MAG: hypothetical protein UR53_C0001G0043 [Candidatus Magasanikbacteria bacterium GW2011_GWC2_34_16]